MFSFATWLLLFNKQMPINNKKKVIKSLETLGEDLRGLLKSQYPSGYEGSITRIINAKKEPIFVFPLETEDTTFLIKVPATKNSDGEYDVESGKKGEFEDDDDYGSSGNYNDNDNDYDEEESGGGSKDPSYDPDFDD